MCMSFVYNGSLTRFNVRYLREVALHSLSMLFQHAFARTRQTYINVLIKVTKCLWLDFDALQALTLQLGSRLDGVHDLELHEREQRTRADTRVRSERHEEVREPIDGHREI